MRQLWCLVLAIGTVVGVAPSALAQTWSGGRTTPALSELFAIDETGESGWLYGSEDLAGDGDTFQQQEQSIDIRTAYASTDNNRFWGRVYISDTNSPGGNISAYFFIDTDQGATTGGSAEAPEIDARFTNDLSGGGYEVVVGIRGNGSVLGVWNWDGGQNMFVSANITPNDVDAEVGSDVDPIAVGAPSHGYLQLDADLDVVGLTAACQANLYVRTTNETAALGDGDLEVGQVGACVPADSNNNGIPDDAETNAGCTDDNQCVADGVCINGRCVPPTLCSDPADCPNGDTCQNGRCIATPGGSCTDSSECNGLICSGGQCVPCTSGGDQCGAGRVCGPDGRCRSDSGGGGAAGSTGVELEPGQEIQGGACACSWVGRRVDTTLLWLSAAVALLILRRRRSR